MSDVRNLSIKELGQYFELSIIDLQAKEKMAKSINRAADYNLSGIIVPHFLIDYTRELTEGTGLRIGSAVCFPSGADDPSAKALSAEKLAEKKVTDIDFVMNYGALVLGYPELVEQECALIRKAAPNVVLKMILEVCYLTDDQIRTACEIAAANGIDYIKSSTGQVQGPTIEQACLIVDQTKKYGMHSKVAGVKFPRPQNAMAYLLAGIEKIGTQQPFEILDGIQVLRDRGIF